MPTPRCDDMSFVARLYERRDSAKDGALEAQCRGRTGLLFIRNHLSRVQNLHETEVK